MEHPRRLIARNTGEKLGKGEWHLNGRCSRANHRCMGTDLKKECTLRRAKVSTEGGRKEEEIEKLQTEEYRIT